MLEDLADRQSAEFARLAAAIERRGDPAMPAGPAAPAPKERPAALSDPDEVKILKRKYRRAQADAVRLKEELAEAQRQDEVKILKRKYRRAQADAVRLKEELAEAQRQLAQAMASTEPMRTRIRHAVKRSLESMARQIPGGKRRLDRSRQRRELALITSSDLFDAAWYLDTYPDIAEAGLDPAAHYLKSGWQETRDPGPDFSTSGYLKANRDVARSGINPLLHYIEHGMSEGRSVGVGVRPQVARSTEIFAPPAPCVQFAFARADTIRWQRSHALLRSCPDPVTVDGLAVGRALCSPDVLDALAQRLTQLTGCTPVIAGPVAEAGAPPIGHATPEMVDAWFLRQTMLRMNWSGVGGEARIVRAMQWTAAGGVSLVGEGLVSGSLSFIDLELRTALHPLLLIFATPDGIVVGADLLSFPSLCRGGLHHAELGPPCGTEAGGHRSLVVRSRALEDAWAATAGDDRSPLLRNLRINLAASDGAEPVLQNDLQSWLADVMQIGLAEPIGPSDGNPKVVAFLADKACASPVHATGRRSAATGTLELSADCFPTIGILVASATEHASAPSDQVAVSLICTTEDPALGALAAILPPCCPNLEVEKPLAADRLWPLLLGACPPRGVPGAIRCDGIVRADARLLEPTAQSVALLGESPRSAAVTLVLAPAQWAEDGLAAAMLALARQSGAEIAEVCCLGQAEAGSMRLIELALNVPVRSVFDTPGVLRELRTELVLYLGTGVVLHDHRTLAVLSDLVLRNGIVGAACPLLAHSRQGRDWSLAVADAGTAICGSASIELASEITRLWDSIMPVATLPDDLWLARRQALSGSDPVHGMQILTTQLTASYHGSRNPAEAKIDIMLPPASQALELARWLA
ncbi:hypothetical protein [Novosphingobium aerophilum]|uniref:Uncharacterized protein n=1 Tax=Novosphingobium aerophilum TaxID=2839843 RepID=A0A7X1F782_9SPHN|nr:hypothetical protein [Novosphingobium aerophilum]MBC2651534.1 hypothetical protein [Novosphingobium aerophilum]